MQLSKGSALFSLFLSAVSAFSNSAPVYVSNNRAPLSHYMSSEDVGTVISLLEGRTTVFRIPKALHESFTRIGLFGGFQHSDKVFYENKSFSSEFKPISLTEVTKEGENGFFVTDITESSVEEFMRTLDKVPGNVVFEFIPEKKERDVSRLQFRELSTEAMDEDNLKLEDLDKTFSKLIEEAKAEGGMVSISDADVEYDNPKKPNVVDSAEEGKAKGDYKEIKVQGGSLLDTYQFFSSGILSATIVSLFLVYVLIQGLSWVSSMQISYRALEKPVDGRKKAK